MLDAINTSQMAMNLDQFKLQTISHNIANISTNGFKKQYVESFGFDEQVLQQSQLDTQGVLDQTKNPKDLAISGPGYFTVQGPRGIFYTRRGDFQINKFGELTTATGELLLGTGGVIKVDDAAFTIDAQGALIIDQHKVDQLKLVQFNTKNQVHYIGNGLYESDASPVPVGPSTKILQGFIEQSNVKSIDEMMDMIAFSRHFETNQRIMRTADNLLATAINQLGEGNV